MSEMNREKALGLVDSIIATHADAVRAESPAAHDALENARLDMRGLVNEIFETCGNLLEQTREENRRG